MTSFLTTGAIADGLATITDDGIVLDSWFPSPSLSDDISETTTTELGSDAPEELAAADAEALATDSSLSAHPASVAACMARPPAWESRPQKRETRYKPATWMAATMLVRRSSSSWPGAASC